MFVSDVILLLQNIYNNIFCKQNFQTAKADELFVLLY